MQYSFSKFFSMQALFTQSSPVREPLLQAFPFPSTLGEVTLHPLSLACVFIYSSCGKWVFPLSCGVFLPPPFLQSFPFLIDGQCCGSCSLVCLFTAHMGGGSSPISCGIFLPLPLSQAFPLLVAGCRSPHPPEPLCPGLACLFTVPGRIPLPCSSELRAPHLLCNMSLLFLLLITQFLLFPVWGSICPRGYADLTQGCLWKYRIPLSSPCLCLPKLSERGWLAAREPSWFLNLT
jgi:hypothetical protein